jgi:hypothetical protein
MIGIAWSLLKARKADKALDVAEAIIAKYPDSYMIPEAHLVRGYSYYMDSKWSESKKALEECKRLTERELISQAIRDSAKTEYDGQKDFFEKVQDRLKVLSGRLPTKRVMKQRDQLKPDVIKANDQIENYAAFLKKALESDQYEKNRQRILSDAKFTLAIVSQKMGGSAAPVAPSDDDDLSL